MERTVAIEPGDLCLDCGMCCTGAVFTHVNLTRPDKDRLIRAGFGNAAGQDRLDFPCRFLDGKCCSIYPSRPAVCASYRCKTLAQAQDGAISIDEAKGRLSKVVELRRAFEAAIPGGMAMPDAVAMAAREEAPGQRMPGHYLPMRLAFVALQAIIDRHLREETEGVVRPRMG